MTPNRGRVSTLIIFSSLHAGQLEDDQFKTSNCFQTMIIILLLKILFPPSWNVGHSKNFPTDYGDGEKTLLPLIIKHWDSIWVTKYVLIKIACSFPCTSLYMTACMSFYWKRPNNDAQLKIVWSTHNLKCLIFEYKI